jgi:hypothetical protein
MTMAKTTPSFDIDNPDRSAIAAQLGLKAAPLEQVQAAPSVIVADGEDTLSTDAIQLPAREAKEPLAQLNVRVRVSVQKRLRDYCYRHNVSQSEVIEFLLGQALPLPGTDTL